MNITWQGQSCFKIEEKIKGETVTVVTDPYTKEVGFKMPKTRAHIVTTSHDHFDHNNVEEVQSLDDAPVTIFERPGEYEVKGVFIGGIGSYHDKKEGAERGKSIMFKFDFDGIKVLHLGDLGTTLSEKQLEMIGDVDILLIPVGGKYTINAKEAADVVKQIDPRIVVPMHYKIKGLSVDIEGNEAFIKEMGNNAETLPKLKINKKDLPQEATKLVILEKN
jgi:L-ascorbate metabolism protein UlaG (beta-lactamase superfamily)